MFVFWSAWPGTLVTVKGQQVSRNKWVYDTVTSKISPKRIANPGRDKDICDWLPELPAMPRVYHVHCMEYPYDILKMKACDYHHYKDENPWLTAIELDNL